MKLFFVCCLWSAVLVAQPENISQNSSPFDHEYMMGLINHLAYWHLTDDNYFEDDPDPVVEVLFKPFSYQQDSNDASSVYIVYVPDVQIKILLKKSLYHIEEFDATVSNDCYKIIAFQHQQKSPGTNSLNDYVRIDLLEDDVRRIVFENRNQSCTPSPWLLNKIESALRPLIARELPTNAVVDETFFIAPLSPYSNSILIFWSTAKKMLQFSSDADYTSELYWDMLPMNCEVFDMKGDVVTSLQNALGSNAYVTKNWIGRILYNCIVDGYQLSIKD